MCSVLTRCELLSFFSIFGIQNNTHKILYFLALVVNCFHFSVSLGYKTTLRIYNLTFLQLWIAFIFQYLWDTKQPNTFSLCDSLCCELLSFFSIFGIQNNITQRKSFTCQVVNCFHFSVSLGYKTTSSSKTFEWIELWIAFIFQYLWDTKQQMEKHITLNYSCELLSFFSIFGIQNNRPPILASLSCVVNCFHFSVSLGYKTTLLWFLRMDIMLWIAFIFQYLWDTKQLMEMLAVYNSSCELLSFFSIFGIQNNDEEIELNRQNVVNCFHFSVSLGYKTTRHRKYFIIIRLWIAFIFQYLWDTKQPTVWAVSIDECCELLSFFSIFGIQNNLLLYLLFMIIVVNCFHFSVSLGYKTTLLKFSSKDWLLWIAFIFQYLWDTKQQNHKTNGRICCCELLSFFSIFGIQNNSRQFREKWWIVVNCFHFSVSLGYKTTGIWKECITWVLWIAFIFQYLWDTKQQ